MNPYRENHIISKDRYITIYNQYNMKSFTIVVNDLFCSYNCQFLNEEFDDYGFHLWFVCNGFMQTNGKPIVLCSDMQRCEKCIRAENKLLKR